MPSGSRCCSRQPTSFAETNRLGCGKRYSRAGGCWAGQSSTVLHRSQHGQGCATCCLRESCQRAWQRRHQHSPLLRMVALITLLGVQRAVSPACGTCLPPSQPTTCLALLTPPHHAHAQSHAHSWGAVWVPHPTHHTTGGNICLCGTHIHMRACALVLMRCWLLHRQVCCRWRRASHVFLRGCPSAQQQRQGCGPQ